MKKIPKFKNEDEEREFWATHSPLDYFDTERASRVDFPNLKPTVDNRRKSRQKFAISTHEGPKAFPLTHVKNKR